VATAHSDRSGESARGAGITVLAPHSKFINLIVRDNGQGFSFWSPARDSELYGNIVYYNGWDGTDRGHGHGIYAQNRDGTKRLADNIVFSQFSHGIHIYGSDDADLSNFQLEGNILFQNGAPSKWNPERNLLLGGGRMAENAEVISNYTYYSPALEHGENNVGYRAGCQNAVIRDNYFVANAALRLINCEETTLAGNTFVGKIAAALRERFPDNAFHDTPPDATDTFVRPNRFEPGRAHIAVYNWKREPKVAVRVDETGLAPGDEYEIRAVQDYFGAPAIGIYDGGAIEIPMTGWGVAPVPGASAPPSTFPEFGVFVLTRRPAPEPVRYSGTPLKRTR
jgi:hypothetical protein